MSAYVVDKDHIDFMVQAAIAGATDSRGWETPHGGFSWFHDATRYSVKPHLDEPERVSKYSVEVPPSTLGQMLVDECVRSVSYRYPQDDVDEGELPGPVREHAYYLQPYVFEPIDTGRQVYSIGAGLQLAVQPVANTATVAVPTDAGLRRRSRVRGRRALGVPAAQLDRGRGRPRERTSAGATGATKPNEQENRP